MRWRPEGLGNPYTKAWNELDRIVAKVDTPYGIHVQNIHSYNMLLKLESDSRIFEEAIDATLEALRNNPDQGYSQHVDPGFINTQWPVLFRKGGTMVFIPNKEENNV